MTEVEKLRDVLDHFEPAHLGELGDARLMHRRDTKYVLPVESVAALLSEARRAYRVLTIDTRRLFTYRTTYFDSPDLRFYRLHLARHVPRQKVRLRWYLDAGTSFLEVKHTSNKGDTRKERRPVGEDVELAEVLADRTLFSPLQVPAHALGPSLGTHYQRLTLVHRARAERVTVDFSLAFDHLSGHAAFPGVVVVEVKQRKRESSIIHDFMRARRSRPQRLSKYCLGIAALHATVPRYEFKQVLKRLHRLNGLSAPQHLAVS